jgi:hypothetical protein
MRRFVYNSRNKKANELWLYKGDLGPVTTGGPGFVVASAISDVYEDLELLTEGCRLLIDGVEAFTPTLRAECFHLQIPGTHKVLIIPLGYTIGFGTRVSNPTNPGVPGYVSVNSENARVVDPSFVGLRDMDNETRRVPLYGAALADRANGGSWAVYNGAPGVSLITLPTAALNPWVANTYLIFGLHLELDAATPVMFYTGFFMPAALGNTSFLMNIEGMCFSSGKVRITAAIPFDNRRHNIGAGSPQNLTIDLGNYAGVPNVRALAYVTVAGDLNFTTQPQGPGATRVLQR